MATRRIVEMDPETASLVAELAEEAEAGFAPAQVGAPRRGRPPVGDGLARVVHLRVEEAMFEALIARARDEDRGVSEVARAALESYLAGSDTATPVEFYYPADAVAYRMQRDEAGVIKGQCQGT